MVFRLASYNRKLDLSDSDIKAIRTEQRRIEGRINAYRHKLSKVELLILKHSLDEREWVF